MVKLLVEIYKKCKMIKVNIFIGYFYINFNFILRVKIYFEVL